jgi:hypothetical protein
MVIRKRRQLAAILLASCCSLWGPFVRAQTLSLSYELDSYVDSFQPAALPLGNGRQKAALLARPTAHVESLDIAGRETFAAPAQTRLAARSAAFANGPAISIGESVKSAAKPADVTLRLGRRIRGSAINQFSDISPHQDVIYASRARKSGVGAFGIELLLPFQ